ncbi:MAG TPA: prepilin-type N-terminal cleavage/methylation domain-containing protein [Thermoanaerobaculia bacterium]|nr:prepilin-type N-terminal cleavage/methylation domain-containing protein [Thermoanaerobaculia bacterium]
MPRQRGFSLVELLFALLVLTLVIMTSLAVFVERANRLKQASETIIAYQVLANEAEMQRRVPFDELVPGTTFSSETAILAPLQPYATQIDVNSSKAGVKDVTMTITWRKGERVAKLALTRVDTGGGNLW